MSAALSTEVRRVLSGGNPENHWEAYLIRKANGQPQSLLANALVVLRHHPEWKGVLAFNEFSNLITMAALPPWRGPIESQWSDHHDRLATEWLQNNGIHVGVEITAQAVQTVASENAFHPVREYLNGLKWDGSPRVDTWLSTYAGVEPSNYSSGVGRRWLISAVARVFQPGCKADSCLILEGSQGLGKSSLLRILGHPWFADEIADLGSKDAALQAHGVWIIELAELDSLTRADAAKIKAFMSRSSDRFRPPYGKRLIESPRQCVFGGSVNHNNYLRDETGARRFWPVACSRIDLAALKQDRDQLWAEALTLYQDRESWWLDSAALVTAAAAEQADRFEEDPWHEPIANWVEHRSDVSIEQVLTSCLEKKKADWSQSDKNRIARTLRVLGFERYRDRIGNQREWRYRHV